MKTINRQCPKCETLNQPIEKNKVADLLILHYKCKCGEYFHGRCNDSVYKLTSDAVDRICKPEIAN